MEISHIYLIIPKVRQKQQLLILYCENKLSQTANWEKNMRSKKEKRKNVDQFSISLLLLFIQVVAKCCWWVEWMDGGTMLANSHSWNFQNPSLWTFFLCEVTELTPAHPHVRAFHYEFFSFLILVLCFLFSIDPCPTQISH